MAVPDASGSLPDVPADDLLITPSGGSVLTADLGVVISTDGQLPSITHGRGIGKVIRPD